MYLTRFRRRAVAALLATALAMAATAGPALAAESDDSLDTEQMSAATVGETTVFGIDAGSLLNLRLLGEDGLAGINELDGVFEALTRLVPLEISSTLLPALNAASLPALEARSTDGEDRTQAEAPSLSDGLPAPVAGLLDGDIVASLLALVDDAGAKGLTEATVSNLSVLAGLVGLESITTNLGGDVTTARAAGSRSVTVDQLTALDLTGLLDLLGLDLLDLSLEQLTGLAGQLDVLDGVLSTLGLSVGELDTLLSDPLSLFDSLTTALTAASADGAILGDVCDAIGGLGLPLNCAALADITALITELTDQLAILDGLLDLVPSLVNQLLGVLDGAPLLAFGGLDAGVFATAARTVEDSVADIDATMGDVLVAGTVLPGLDLGSTLEQVNALSSQVTGILDGVLGVIGLDGLIDIGVLETTTSVDEVDGVVTALAELTGLRITITPPDVCALLAGIDPTGTVAGLLGQLGQLDTALPELPVPVVGDLIAGLGGGLDCSGIQTFAPAQVGDLVTALSQPLTIEVATISETSTLDVTKLASPGTPATPVAPEKDLPRTGDAIPLALVAVVVAGGIGIRGLIRRSQT